MSDNTTKLFSEFPAISPEEWKEKIINDLKGKEYSSLLNKTEFGSQFEPFYTEETLENIEAVKNYPGKYPFIRGTQTQNSWIITQPVFVSSFENANTEAVKLLNNGVEEIIFVLQNKNIFKYEDLETILKNINLSKHRISFKKQKDIITLQKLFVEYIEKNSFDKTKIKGNFNYSPLACYAVKGHFPPNENKKLEHLYKLLKITKEQLPNYNLVNISTVPFYNSGANTLQEIAIALSQAVEYMALLSEVDKNILPDLLKYSEFTIPIGSDYFIEIAKIRALRWLWAKITKQYGITSTDLQKIKINAVSSLRNKTVYDAHVNMLRVTTETMSAAIAGVKSIAILPFDITYKEPDEFSYRIAKNVQILLKQESYFDKITDPAGGSYYIETLTKELANKSWKLFLELEETNGYLANIENNKIQNLIEETTKIRKQKIATAQHSILGTNKYPNPKETLGNKATKKLFQETPENKNFKLLNPHREAEEFEKLRIAIEQSKKKPKVFLFTYGNLAMRKARAMFSANFFAIAGFNIIDNPGFNNINEGLKEIETQKPDYIVICSSDDEYEQLVPQITEKIQDKNKIIIAGYPKKLIEKFNKIGITNYIHTKSNILEELQKFSSIIN